MKYLFGMSSFEESATAVGFLIRLNDFFYCGSFVHLIIVVEFQSIIYIILESNYGQVWLELLGWQSDRVVCLMEV